MPGGIRSMHLKHVLRDVQTDRGSLLHGRLLWWQFDTVTLAHRCRRGASTPSPTAATRRPDTGWTAVDPKSGNSAMSESCPRFRGQLLGRRTLANQKMV